MRGGLGLRSTEGKEDFERTEICCDSKRDHSENFFGRVNFNCERTPKERAKEDITKDRGEEKEDTKKERKDKIVAKNRDFPVIAKLPDPTKRLFPRKTFFSRKKRGVVSIIVTKIGKKVKVIPKDFITKS